MSSCKAVVASASSAVAAPTIFPARSSGDRTDVFELKNVRKEGSL
ncbi:MAG: hypothetical protein WC375_12895 [Methanomassiliicoccales archaeon]